MVAFYGSPGSSSEERAIPSHLQVFKEGHEPGTSTKAPKYSINLETSQVCMVKPSPIVRRRSSGGKERVGQSFCITTKERDCYEFRAGSDNECQLWINIIKFLIIFPYSCLPLEPSCIKLNFEQVLDPNLYRAG